MSLITSLTRATGTLTRKAWRSSKFSLSRSSWLSSLLFSPVASTALEDQFQVAYALDDIRLAKILLLKLIVPSDNDLRIDEVRDEDLHIYFLPADQLKLEEPERRCPGHSAEIARKMGRGTAKTTPAHMRKKNWEEKKRHLHTEGFRAIRCREGRRLEEFSNAKR
jgi:hypothetical protein